MIFVGNCSKQVATVEIDNQTSLVQTPEMQFGLAGIIPTILHTKRLAPGAAQVLTSQRKPLQ